MKALLILLFPFLLTAGKPTVRNWLGTHDDVSHFYAGFFIGVGTAEVVYHYTKNPNKACWAGFAVGTMVGFAKEYIYDGYFKRGVKSKWDLFYTFWGSLISCMVTRCLFDYREHKLQINKQLQIDYLDDQIIIKPKKHHKTKWSLKNCGLLL